MKNDLHLKAYRLSFIDELSGTNTQKRYDACEQLLRVSEIIPAQEEVLFSDECTIYQSAKSRNVYFWSNENAHFFQELENNTQHVMIWATVSAKHLWTCTSLKDVHRGTYFTMLLVCAPVGAFRIAWT
jgi:hypothetical protein